MTASRRAHPIVAGVLGLLLVLSGDAVVPGWRGLFPATRSFAQPAAPDTALHETLQRYTAALESLDAEAVKKVHPAVPAESLAKAFKDMRGLKVAIDDVRVLSNDGSTARVSCVVKQTLTPHVGSERTTSVTRVVRLRRAGDTWVIDSFER
jgi:hypothetical protein